MPRHNDDRKEKRTERDQRIYDNRPHYLKAPSNIPSALVQRESNPKRLEARQKQIDFGKNTLGYSNYLNLVPRERRRPNDPWTPDKTFVTSKRSWDGSIRKWRKQLHKYDPPSSKVEGEIEIDLNNERDMWEGFSPETEDFSNSPSASPEEESADMKQGKFRMIESETNDKKRRKNNPDVQNNRDELNTGKINIDNRATGKCSVNDTNNGRNDGNLLHFQKCQDDDTQIGVIKTVQD